MGRTREYKSDTLVVRYEAARCIHAAECVRGLPAVFDPERRPWVDVAAGEAAAVAAVVELCPTGALAYQWITPGKNESPPERNAATVMPNGPLHVRGRIQVTGVDGSVVAEGTRLALCRCGASKQKPFCDGSHSEGFVAE